MTQRYQEKTESLHNDIRQLSDTISAKDDHIQNFLQQVSALQTDCDNYETEIQTLFREIKEKNQDMNVLTEAFEKRGLPLSYYLAPLL
jgi:peptidoglycan hydrolase CwlO-like protein